MNKIAIALGMAFLIAGCTTGGDSTADSSTADLGGKTRLKTLLTERFNKELPGIFKEEDNVPIADQPRAVDCMLDAMMADMSDAQAGRAADMLEGKTPVEEDFVRYWIAPRKSQNPARAAQAEDRVRQICPDIAEKLV